MDTDPASRRRWSKAVDLTVTYSSKHVGLGTGLVGALLSPNEWVSTGMVVFGWAWDNAATMIDRHMQKRKGSKDAD